MSRIYQVFVPEYVPLENKGEEAIIRGMSDIIFPEGNAEFHILDFSIRKPFFREGLHVYPASWFYSRWRSQEFRLGLNVRDLYASCCSLARHGLNLVVPGWVNIPQRPVLRLKGYTRRMSSMDNARSCYLENLGRILACDYLIAGHDGAFNEYDCHVINTLHARGMSFGILGSSMKVRERSRTVIGLFGQTLSKADFVFCRNQMAVDWVRQHFPHVDVELAPDPAFGMRPAPSERIDAIITAERLEGFFSKPVVMMTTAEPAPITRYCYENQGTQERRLKRHRSLLAALTEHIVNRHNANVLFLPHATGPTPELDDRKVAEGVIEELTCGSDRVRVLHTDYAARELKGLIGRAQMLVGERIHSLIGAVGVGTPFLCLGVKQDNRVKGIIEKMCGLGEAIYHINEPSHDELFARFDQLWERRSELHKYLQAIDISFRTRLREVGQVVKRQIEEGKRS